MIFKTSGAIGTFLTKWSHTYKGKYEFYVPPRSTEDVGRQIEVVDLPSNFCQATRAILGTVSFMIMTAVAFTLITSYLVLGYVEWFKLLTGIGLVMAASAGDAVDTITSKLLLVVMIIDALGFLVLCGFMLYHSIRVGAHELQDYRARRKGAEDYVPREPSQGWINFKEGVHGVHRKFCPLVKWEDE